MIRPRSRALSQNVKQKLSSYDGNVRTLPGIANSLALDCLVAQIVDSIRRVEFAHHLRDAIHDPRRAVPYSGLFDPLRAAVLKNRAGRIDEAYWLVFLATHFGKHAEDGWALAESVYGKLNHGGLWDWPSISRQPNGFDAWVATNASMLRQNRFSNHRKYESISSNSAGLSRVVQSYVDWIRPHGTHVQLVRDIHQLHGQNPKDVFHEMYVGMRSVHRFGRLGRFDFLTMLGKLAIAPIEADSAYLQEATGPLRGARLLFCGNVSDRSKDRLMSSLMQELDDHTNLGMQVLEDSLCNWQKSPIDYQYFNG